MILSLLIASALFKGRVRAIVFGTALWCIAMAILNFFVTNVISPPLGFT